MRLDDVVLLIRVCHQIHIKAKLHAQSHHVAEALVRIVDHDLQQSNSVLLLQERRGAAAVFRQRGERHGYVFLAVHHAHE